MGAHSWRFYLDIDSFGIYGLKSDVIPLPHGKLKQTLEDLVPDRFARFLTHRLHAGSFLVVQMHKR